MPIPGLEDAGRDIYKTTIEISSRLGKALQVVTTKVDADGLPVVVTTIPGKVLQKTEFWLNYFGKDREAPSPEAYDRCFDIINGVYDKVVEAYARHAKNGLLANVTTPYVFGKSIRWSDNLDECIIDNFNPETTNLGPKGQGITSYMRGLVSKEISEQDIRITEAMYTIHHTRRRVEYERVRGWCEYFRTSVKPLEFSYE